MKTVEFTVERDKYFVEEGICEYNIIEEGILIKSFDNESEAREMLYELAKNVSEFEGYSLYRITKNYYSEGFRDLKDLMLYTNFEKANK